MYKPEQWYIIIIAIIQSQLFQIVFKTWPFNIAYYAIISSTLRMYIKTRI